MGSTYLNWLPDIARVALKPHGINVELFDSNWLYRSRSSGGYDGLPLCVMWHHTASSSPARNGANYGTLSASARPIANIYIDHQTCVIAAGGRTNTNGAGESQQFSRGTVPKDSMNNYAVGIEICNNGVGQDYPQNLIDGLFALSNAINDRCGNRPEDVCTHTHYSPGRKIDPATMSAVQGSWKPRGINTSGSWSVNDLRSECMHRASKLEPKPEPVKGVYPMFEGIVMIENRYGHYAVFSNKEKKWIPYGQLEHFRNLEIWRGNEDKVRTIQRYKDTPASIGMFKTLGAVVGPRQKGADIWGVGPKSS